MSEDADVAAVATLLADDTARGILAETSVEPMSAATLAARLEVSQPTIYRRIQDLEACNLISQRTQLDPEAGHHKQVYAANLNHLRIDLADGEMTLRIERPESMADAFTRLVEGL